MINSAEEGPLERKFLQRETTQRNQRTGASLRPWGTGSCGSRGGGWSWSRRTGECLQKKQLDLSSPPSRSRLLSLPYLILSRHWTLVSRREVLEGIQGNEASVERQQARLRSLGLLEDLPVEGWTWWGNTIRNPSSSWEPVREACFEKNWQQPSLEDLVGLRTFKLRRKREWILRLLLK